MARLDPAIRHAITAPEFGENKLHREHLVDRLHGDIPNKLVAIAAPAGYGKTTLLADFVAHTELPVCWVQVTEADRDLMRLVSVIFASLEKRFRRLRGELDLEAYAGSSPVSLARTLVDIIERNIPENFILIVDDVHRIHVSEDCRAFFDELLTRLPEQMTVFAAGREVLEVSLARLMAEGQLSGLGPHDLALGDQQIRELIRLHSGNELSDRQVSKLRATTRGWITGVLLSEYGSAKASLSDGLPESLVYEYLASVVLNRQKDDIRRFMLDASILPIMTAEACDVVLGRDDSEVMLGRLSEKGLFLTVAAEDPRSYEFHPIFRDLLTETLESTDPERYRQLRRRGAEYYRNSAPEVAVGLHLTSGDYDEAARIVEEISQDLYRNGRFSTIESWLTAFPEPSDQAPSLHYCYARILLERGYPEEALETVEQLAEDGEGSVPQVIEAKALILKGFIYLELHDTNAVERVLQTYEERFSGLPIDDLKASYFRLAARHARKSRDPDATIANLNEAVKLLERSSDKYQLATALQQKAAVYGTAGKFAEARKATMEALDIVERYASPLMRAYSHNDMGQIEYLDGDFERALRYYDEARTLARLAGSERFEAHILYGQGDVYSDVGLPYQAAELYAEGLNIATVLGYDQLVRLGCLATAVLHRRVESLKLASEWLQRAISTPGRSHGQAIEIQSAALIAQSSPNKALERLDRLIQAQAEDLSAKEITETTFFQVFALYSMERYQEALVRLRECLDHVSLHGTEQHMAAEIALCPGVLDWALTSAPSDPTLLAIAERTERILAMKSRYLKDQGDEAHSGFSYRISAFGGLEVAVGDSKMNDNMKPQALEVFIYLLDQGTTERDKLADVFWPDHSPGRQTANLHMAVYSIRQAIGKDMVNLEGSTYSLSDDVDWRYDVREFERAFSVAMSLPYGDPRRMFALTEATNRYDGPFLPEFFSEWVEERRRELELSYLDVVAANAEEAMRRDAPDRALGPLREALKLDPYRDDLNRHYLEVLARLDRRSDALMHYQKYASLIKEELGLEPSPRVKEVVDSISRAQT